MRTRDIIWDIKWCPHENKANQFVSASADCTAKLWLYDSESKTALTQMAYVGHTGSVNTIRFHPSQSILCTASGDRTCHIWKPLDVTPPSSFVSIRCLIRREDMEKSIHRSLSHRHSADTPSLAKPLATLVSHQGPVMVAEWNADGSQVLSGSQDATIKIWELNSWTKPLLTLTGHDSTITSIAHQPSNSNVFCSCTRYSRS